MERDGSRCVICRQPANTVHHIVAIEDGGAWFDIDNLVTLCRRCHGGEDGVRTQASKAKTPKDNRFMHTVIDGKH